VKERKEGGAPLGVMGWLGRGEGERGSLGLDCWLPSAGPSGKRGRAGKGLAGPLGQKLAGGKFFLFFSLSFILNPFSNPFK